MLKGSRNAGRNKLMSNMKISYVGVTHTQQKRERRREKSKQTLQFVGWVRGQTPVLDTKQTLFKHQKMFIKGNMK